MAGGTDDLLDTTGTTDTGDDGGLSWGDITGVPDVLQDLSGTARDLLSSPRRTVLGIVAGAIVSSIFKGVEWTINLVLVLFRGTEPGIIPQPGESLGIADTIVSVALWIQAHTSGVVGGIGIGIVEFNSTVASEITGAVGLGPVQPVVFVAVFAVEAYIGYELATRLFRAVLDALPVTSGIETFIFK